MPCPTTLDRYCRDRRLLLELLLSSSSPSPELDGVDLDSVSVDYALQCAASGEPFESTEATRRYYEELRYPITISFTHKDSHFYLSTSETDSSPPERPAPRVRLGAFTDRETRIAGESNYTAESNTVFSTTDSLTEAVLSGDESSLQPDIESIISGNGPSLNRDAVDVTLDIPMSTEFTDDDMRETAYEVLVASLYIGGRLHFSEKKEKRSKFLKNLSFRKENLDSHVDSRDAELLEAVRAQMEISETMDILTKEGLRLLRSKGLEQVVVPHISIELLNAISRLDFPSERLRMKWRNRQANILEELLLCTVSNDANMSETLKILLTKLRSSEGWIIDVRDGHVEILTVINRYISKFASKYGKYCSQSKSCHWLKIFYFNVTIYEKLLGSVFDVLEEGQLVEGADDVLEFIKETWSILGFTQRLHYAFYAWVLFRKFVQTGENFLLRCTIDEIQKFASSKDAEEIEAHLGSHACPEDSCDDKQMLTTFSEEACNHDNQMHLNLISNIFSKMNAWCCSLLEDYHLNFGQENKSTFEGVLSLAILSRMNPIDGSDAAKSTDSRPEYKLIQELVEKSIETEYKRVMCLSDGLSTARIGHRLAVGAKELILVVEKEFTKFSPTLCKFYPEAEMLALILLHELHGEQLRTYLEGTELLLENVKEVLATSNDLELCLAHKLKTMYGEDVKLSMGDYLHPYQIRHYSSPLILQWLHSQHENIMEWTKRAIEMEVWEPLSVHQRVASSAVEVFRIVEETIDLFINLHIPMGSVHLRCLLIGIVRFLEVYLQNIASEQVLKTVLYPSAPLLTRYAEYSNPFVKKRYLETPAIDEKMEIKMSTLTVPKLCMKLNTLNFIRNQLGSVEETIKESWSSVQSAYSELEYLSQIASELVFVEYSTTESVDELFTIFDDVKRDAIDTSDAILEFIGAKLIFWDLRDCFLFSLYRDGVENSRLEMFIPLLDQVLDQICDIIIDELRDETVLRVLQASLEGFVWVLLDGGPSRAFSDSDVELMNDDLIILKDLFLADGQGLSPDLVEREAKFAQQILDLYALKAEAIIELLLSVSELSSYKFQGDVTRTKTMSDAQILLRILCHKKENKASEFLKTHYQLAKSSDYEDIRGRDQSPKSPTSTYMIGRQRSFKMMKNTVHSASGEMRN